MSKLPIGWCNISLSSLCTRIVDGSHNPPKSSPNGNPMLSARNIQNRQIIFSDYRLISDKDFAIEHERTRVSSGDVLMTIVGTIGRTAVVPSDIRSFALQRSVAVLKPFEAIYSKYIAYILESPNLQRHFEENAKGTAQKGIYLKALSEVVIPLAPLNEQKRIADKLDTILARVDECRERLDRVPAILKRFRQAVLAAAISGKLTEDWRINNSNLTATDDQFKENFGHKLSSLSNSYKQVSPFNIPNEWLWVKCSDIIKSIRGGSTCVPQDSPTPHPILRSSSVRAGSVDLDDIRYLPESVSESNYISEGDLLFTRLSGSLEYVANCGMVRELGGRRIIYPDRLFCAKLSDSVLTSYGEIVFSAPQIHEQVTSKAKSSAGHQRVSISDINAQIIPLPPINEQHEIVRRIETLFTYADQLEARYNVARTQVEQLTAAMLAKAFRGELVPQDPNDEPASVLLERIRAERAAQESTGKNGRKAAGKKNAKEKETAQLDEQPALFER